MPSKSSKWTVIIADDNPQVLALVAQKLTGSGYDVIESTDGEQALSLARERRPDGIVLDVMMPGRSGWEVCRSIREDENLSDMAVIMLTGIGERLNEMTSPLYGADDYIDKPFDFGELEKRLRAAIRKRQKG